MGREEKQTIEEVPNPCGPPALMLGLQVALQVGA